MDAIRRALHRAARSPFSGDIEWAPMPSRFTRPPFNSYDGKTDLVENVSHYIQIMSLHSNNDALMCKVFPSSLKPTALRWFNWLRKGSIGRTTMKMEAGKLFATILADIGNCTTRLVGVMKKSQQALSG